MDFGSLVQTVSALPCFDLPLLVQAFDDPRAVVRVQLSRWMKQGKLTGLRRGVYCLPETYRRTPLTPAVLANHLYHPSYLSGLWALSYYDLIPERVVWLTSVTPRVPRRFENPVGIFDYRNIKQDCFFGYVTAAYGDEEILVAEPEKALLDHWHLARGEWTTERLQEMRYQHSDQISEDRLKTCLARFHSPRLGRAVERWRELMRQEREGTVEL